MIGEDGDASTRCRQLDGCVEGRRQDLELAVHLDPDRLERALGRVPSGAPGGGGDGCGHDPRQLDRRLHGTGGDDGPGDASGEALVAVDPQDAGQLRGVVAVDHVGRRPRRRRVHAHVEGTIVAVREPALGLVELRRGDAEVEERSTEASTGEQFVGQAWQVVEATANGVEAGAESLEPLRRGGDGFAVAVDAEHLEIDPAVQERLGMTAAAERGVHDDAGRHAGEHLDDLVAHHRTVEEHGVHSCPPASSPRPVAATRS